MKITITTHKIPQNSRYKDLPCSAYTLQYVSTCNIGGSPLNSSGRTREEAIEHLKALIECNYPDLEQVEVTFPFEKPSKVPEGTGGLE